MPDTALSQAIREAYASAPVRGVVYDTVEIYHAAFSAPIRVVRDFPSLDARLEATAPRDASAVVTFVGFQFDIVAPEVAAVGTPECVLTVDNVSREVGDQLDQAILAGGQITLIYRRFMAGNLNIGPETNPPPVLTLTSVRVDAQRVTARCGYPPDMIGRRFPRLDYSAEIFTGLVA